MPSQFAVNEDSNVDLEELHILTDSQVLSDAKQEYYTI